MVNAGLSFLVNERLKRGGTRLCKVTQALPFHMAHVGLNREDACMELIDGGRAPSPRRVRVFLAEKGIDVPRRQIDFANREQMSDAFRTINPMQRVPVLILDDGTAISETMAICRYFDALHPEPNLLGRDPQEIAVIEMWNRRVELNFYGAVSSAFRHLSPAMAPSEQPQIAEWGEANKAKALAFLAILDRELATRKFVAGDRYTVADITTLCTVDFMRAPKIELPVDMTNVKRWHDEVSARPSARA
jgi:glutathione S-transferase